MEIINDKNKVLQLYEMIMEAKSGTNGSPLSLTMDQKCESKSELCDFVLDDTIRYITDASTVLKCSIITRTKAMLIYHYFRRCVHETKYDSYLVAAACISLSIKYNEEPVKFESIILVFFHIVEKGACRSTQDKEFKNIKKSLILIETLVLRMLEFSLNHVLAHEYVVYFMYDLREELSTLNVWDVFSEMCSRLVSDFYLSKKCINYRAEDIAVTVVQVSLYLIGINASTDSCPLQAWLKTLNNCKEETKLDIIEDIFRISNLGPVAESNI